MCQCKSSQKLLPSPAHPRWPVWTQRVVSALLLPGSPPSTTTLGKQSQRSKKAENPSSQPPGIHKEGGTLLGSCGRPALTPSILRTKTEKQTQTNQTKSASEEIKQWLLPTQFTSAVSWALVLTATAKPPHMTFSQGTSSIAEEFHCKNHSWLQPQMSCLNSQRKTPKRGNTKKVNCQSEEDIWCFQLALLPPCSL